MKRSNFIRSGEQVSIRLSITRLEEREKILHNNKTEETPLQEELIYHRDRYAVKVMT